jgi:two-component system OmpR family sensor kinase
MTSIRTRLLVSLLGALTLAGLGAAAGVYLKASDEAHRLFDYQLKQTAFSLRDHAATAVAVTSSIQGDVAQEIIVQIWDDEGLHLYHSHPGSQPLPHTPQGLTTVATPQGAWQVFTLAEDERVIQVAQPLHIRRTMAAAMATRTLLPWLIAMSVLGVLMWWLVGRSLQPLTTVARAIQARTPQALDPLATTRLPREISPLVVALNALLERLSTALTAQRAFIADAAHALRTPLTAVHLQAQLVARATEARERQQAIDALQQGVQRATHLVQQLLTLARLEPEASERPLVLVKLNPLLHAVLVEHAPIAAEKTIDLGLVRDDPAQIMGDADSLRLLFGNLLENALRYTPAGGTVDVHIISAPDAVIVEVADTGPGIPLVDRVRVFDRFYRRDATSMPGSGLGLAIVKASAERHNAHITLSAPDIGTGLVVRVTFPTTTCPILCDVEGSA